MKALNCIKTTPALCIALILILGCSTGRQHSLNPSLDIPYPLSGKPKPNEIYHVPTGLLMSFENAIDMIASARLVCIGETHDNIHAHHAELQVIEELERRFPGQIAIGMEMFRAPQQAILDQWIHGDLTETDFLKATDWSNTWAFDFDYYRAILEFAREHRIDVLALNVSKSMQEKVRNIPLNDLPAELHETLPEMSVVDPYQLAAMRAVYGGHLPTVGMFDSFFRVQVLWEESMASRIVDYLNSERGQGKKMITITGGWHVRYGFGIPKKVVRRLPMPYVILETEEIEIPPDKQDRMMDIQLPPIPLLPADFIWYVPYESLERKSN